MYEKNRPAYRVGVAATFSSSPPPPPRPNKPIIYLYPSCVRVYVYTTYLNTCVCSLARILDKISRSFEDRLASASAGGGRTEPLGARDLCQPTYSPRIVCRVPGTVRTAICAGTYTSVGLHHDCLGGRSVRYHIGRVMDDWLMWLWGEDRPW